MIVYRLFAFKDSCTGQEEVYIYLYAANALVGINVAQ